MKNKHVLLLSLSLLMGSTVSFSQKTDKEIEKGISSKAMKLARKDMGKKETKIKLDDFMLFYMQDESAYKEFKKINNW